MTEISKRLRKRATAYADSIHYGPGKNPSDYLEGQAADELDRLTAEVAEWKAAAATEAAQRRDFCARNAALEAAHVQMQASLDAMAKENERLRDMLVKAALHNIDAESISVIDDQQQVDKPRSTTAELQQSKLKECDMIWLGEKLVSVGMFYRREPTAMPYTICVAIGVVYIAAAIALR